VILLFFAPEGRRFLSRCALGICEGYEVALPPIHGEQIRHHFPSYGQRRSIGIPLLFLSFIDQGQIMDASGQVHQEGKVGATRWELDDWMKMLPQPWTVTMEATIFTGWIYDHLLPHAQQVKVAHPLMLRAIAAAKKKNDRIDAGEILCWPSESNGSGRCPEWAPSQR
jgi:hypothetical protein